MAFVLHHHNSTKSVTWLSYDLWRPEWSMLGSRINHPHHRAAVGWCFQHTTQGGAISFSSDSCSWCRNLLLKSPASPAFAVGARQGCRRGLETASPARDSATPAAAESVLVLNWVQTEASQEEEYNQLLRTCSCLWKGKVSLQWKKIVVKSDTFQAWWKIS